jgi:hypothetical protein
VSDCCFENWVKKGDVTVKRGITRDDASEKQKMGDGLSGSRIYTKVSYTMPP